MARTYNVHAMEGELKPSKAEKELLTLAYNRFYDLFEEIMSDTFWEKEAYYRFSKIRDVFSIYVEVLKYPPIREVIDYLKNKRPPMEAEIGSAFFAFIRNVMVHFPFFQRWDDIWVNRTIVNWDREGQSIDRFLAEYQGHEPVKYRFWETEKKKMSYMSVNFPVGYTSGKKIFLKDLISERDGVKFSVILMKKILDTQVESP